MHSYSVHLARADGSFDNSPAPSVEATDPLHAAEAVLGRPLALSGRRKAAIVWELRDDLSPYCTVLFDVETTE